jgi:hypothetical protein
MILDGKPRPGSALEARAITRFSHLCREINWHKAFAALDTDTLLVIDPEIQAAIEANYGQLKCHISAPGMVSQIPKGVVRLLYLCRTREWKRVKLARSRRADLAVFSLTYDIAPLGFLEDGRFPYQATATPEAGLPPVVDILLSMPGSDSEYLRLMLEKNGLSIVRPIAGRALAYWILLSDYFHVLRFASMAFTVAATAKGPAQLDMYTLLMVFQHTVLSSKAFVRWFDAGKGSMLYFISRDKVRLTAVNQLLENAHYASVWDRAEATVSKLSYQSFDRNAALNQLTNTFELETSLEESMQEIAAFKMMTLEDLVVMPEAVLTAIAYFWGGSVPREPTLINWHPRYRVLPEFMAQLAVLRDEVIAAYGLEDSVRG